MRTISRIKGTKKTFQVNLNIDYEKLSETLIDINLKTEEIKREKDAEKSKNTMELFLAIAFIVFFTLCIISVLFAHSAIKTFSFEQSVPELTMSIFSIMMYALLPFILVKACFVTYKELKKETDRNYLVMTSTCLIAVMTLIFTIVELLLRILKSIG